MKSLLTLLNKMDSTPLVNEFLNRVSISIRSDKIEKTNVKKIDKAENKTTYTVQHGDNLWKISKMFDIDLESLRSMNDLKSDILSPGSILIVSSFED